MSLIPLPFYQDGRDFYRADGGGHIWSFVGLEQQWRDTLQYAGIAASQFYDWCTLAGYSPIRSEPFDQFDSHVWEWVIWN